MPTTFSITFDGIHGLVLVAGETIVTDIIGVNIARNLDGTFHCEVSRGEQTNPVKLVASATPEGRALERANGRESGVPGFVEVKEPGAKEPAGVLKDVAEWFGCGVGGDGSVAR